MAWGGIVESSLGPRRTPPGDANPTTKRASDGEAPGLDRLALEALAKAWVQDARVKRVLVQTFRYKRPKVTARLQGGVLRYKLHPNLLPMPSDAARGLILGLATQMGLSCPDATPAERAAWTTHLDATPVAKRDGLHDPHGHHHSLTELYLDTLFTYDLHLDAPPRVGWSPQPVLTKLGWYDRSQHMIVLNRLLDDPRVPDWVVSSTLYHEVLHITHPPRVGATGKRNVHHAGFRNAERRNPKLAAFEAWIRSEYPKLMPGARHREDR